MYIYSTQEVKQMKNDDVITNRFLEVADKLNMDKHIKSDRDLAKKLGIYGEKMSRIRTGIIKADASTIMELCKQFSFVSIEYIMLGKGNLYISESDSFESWIEDQGISHDLEKKFLLPKIKEAAKQIIEKFKEFKNQSEVIH